MAKPEPPTAGNLCEAVRVTAEPCAECPWKGRCPGLRSGRLRDLREETRRKDGVFICHKTMLAHGGSRKVFGAGDGPAVCSGWMEVGDHPAELQIAERLGFIAEVNERGERL